MEDSILLSVKKIIGFAPEDDTFDVDVLIYINSVLFALYQLGLGSQPFVVNGSAETWSNLYANENKIMAIRSYVCQKSRLKFDPPTSTAMLEALKESIKEDEWRILSELNYHNS